MNIAIIGAGNVAWHLAQALQNAGHSVTAIYSRAQAPREELAQLLPHAKPISSLNLLNVTADVVIVAVPDAALAAVASELQVASGTLVAHTSGSVPVSVLQQVRGGRIGVFYPLQTFTKAKPVDFTQVPLLVEAQEKKSIEQLEQLALSITPKVQKVNSEKRRQLHLAAVFACNFTNHLLGISQELLQKAGLPQELLQPLVQETVAKAMKQHPYTVQTGPAVRRDENVIQAHLQMLQQHPRLQELYRLLSESIQAKGS